MSYACMASMSILTIRSSAAEASALKQVHILEWGSGNVVINLDLIYVCHQPPLTIRSGSGRNSDQDWADRMQEVRVWCQDS
jgi:hypothetical protein